MCLWFMSYLNVWTYLSISTKLGMNVILLDVIPIKCMANAWICELRVAIARLKYITKWCEVGMVEMEADSSSETLVAHLQTTAQIIKT